MSEELKACPMCGESILAIAIKCKHCGSFIGGEGVKASNTISPSPELVGATAMPNQTDSIVYAGFWTRFAALWVDGIVLSGLLILFILAAAMISAFSSDTTNSDLFAVFFYIIYFSISALYFSIMESGSKSATYGKRWMGIKVVDINGNRISGGRAFVRWFSHLFSNITIYIGYLIQPFTQKKQALHDMMSGTFVVADKDNKSPTKIVIAIAGIVFAIAFIGILAAVAIPAYQDYVNKAKAAKASAQSQSEGAKQTDNFYTDAQLQSIASQLNSTLPMMVDKETRLDSTVGILNEFTYTYTLVNTLSTDVSVDQFIAAMEQNIIKRACTTNELYDAFIKHGVTVSYAYYGKDSRMITKISVTPRHCDSKQNFEL